MTTERGIANVYKKPGAHWVGDGFHVHGYFGAYPSLAQKLNPFLLLDYAAPYEYEPTQSKRRGVGPHPHRGFETVTLAFEGSVAHHDSTGSGGVIGPGDAQWMTAGAGILHREYHEEKFARSGGTMHMAQIWVNLPSKDKMTTPRYQALTAQQMGRVVLPESAGLVRVIAGEHAGVKGPASTFTPITMLDVQLDRAARVELDVPATQNAALLVMSGSVTVNGKSRATTDDLVLLDSGEHVGEHIAIASDDAARVLVLAGEPIREPIVQYGPFVMNTRQEIEQAIIDFNAGKFGHLDD